MLCIITGAVAGVAATMWEQKWNVNGPTTSGAHMHKPAKRERQRKRGGGDRGYGNNTGGEAAWRYGKWWCGVAWNKRYGHVRQRAGCATRIQMAGSNAEFCSGT